MRPSSPKYPPIPTALAVLTWSGDPTGQDWNDYLSDSAEDVTWAFRALKARSDVAVLDKLDKLTDDGVELSTAVLLALTLPIVRLELAGTTGTPETIKQRRARLLQWFEETSPERGAVQRVYERERREKNSRADRSDIGKQIKIAKKERADSVPTGNLASQLVRNGKRQS